MLQVEIRVKGNLDPNWTDWFDGLIISHSAPGETVLTGLIADQSALYGIIARVRDLGLQLSFISSVELRDRD